MARGYSAVGLHNPKSSCNIGAALRAAWVYRAAMLAVTGRGKKITGNATDTMDPWRNIPVVKTDDLHSVIPHGCVPVAVDIIDGALDLRTYEHPERAFYVFGPEDGTLGMAVTSWCRDVVYVPTRGCMNLAASVNVVLYDRMVKRND